MIHKEELPLLLFPVVEIEKSILFELKLAVALPPLLGLLTDLTILRLPAILDIVPCLYIYIHPNLIPQIAN